MFGDQYKAWLLGDWDELHKPIPMPPGLPLLRTGVGVVVLGSIVTALFGWTWTALIVFTAVVIPVVAVGVIIWSRRPRPRHPTDYR